jgi:hypothetical protein
MPGVDVPRDRYKPGRDSFRTDAWLLAVFEHWFDPCPFNPNWNPIDHLDGLEIPWAWKTYVNPPYSNPKPWVAKAIDEHAMGKTVVMLLKHDSSTRWYAMLKEAGAHFLMVEGRLRYGTKKGAAFPSVLAVLS